MINHSIIPLSVYQAFFYDGGISMKFEDYLQRAELVSLQNFLKHGGETYTKTSEKTYSEQLCEARKNAKAFFEEKYPDIDEYDRILGYFDEQISVYEEVYFEIGLIVGAKIGFQFRGKFDELS